MTMNNEKKGSLILKERHLNVSLDVVEQQITVFCKERFVEGWLCYTSSLWVKRGSQVWQQCDFISGSSTDRGVLLNAEFSHQQDGRHTSLHIRSDAGRYSIYCFEVSFGTASAQAQPVQIIEEAFYGAIPQDRFPQWKLKYANCWGLETIGTAPHDIQVWQPQVGVFLGFDKGAVA